MPVIENVECSATVSFNEHSGQVDKDEDQEYESQSKSHQDDDQSDREFQGSVDDT